MVELIFSGKQTDRLIHFWQNKFAASEFDDHTRAKRGPLYKLISLCSELLLMSRVGACWHHLAGSPKT